MHPNDPRNPRRPRSGQARQAPHRAGNPPARRRPTPAARPRRPRRTERSRRKRAARRRKRHGEDRRHRLVPARVQPAAAPDRGRRGAHRPGAGAVRHAMRLRGHRSGPAPLLRLGRALPQCHRLHRLAGRSDGRAEARQPHRRGDPDPRSQARRSRAGPRAEIARVLHRLARLPPHARRAPETPARTRPQRRGAVPHPGPGRPEHRSRHRPGNRPLHHRRDRRGPPRCPVPQKRAA